MYLGIKILKEVSHRIPGEGRQGMRRPADRNELKSPPHITPPPMYHDQAYKEPIICSLGQLSATTQRPRL